MTALKQKFKPSSRSWLVAFVVILAVACEMLAQAPAPSPLPKLSLIDQTGQSQQLSDYQGRIIVLNFWATWCGPCRDELPILSKLADKYSDKSVVFIAASIDDSDTRPKIPEFLRRKKITNLPIWVGATSDTLKQFDLGIMVPATVIFDQDGQVVGRIWGESSSKDIASRLDWVLNGRTGKAPKALLKHMG